MTSTQESESTSSPSSFSQTLWASKSRMNMNTQSTRRSEGQQRCGAFIATLGVTLVMLYLISMISQVNLYHQQLQQKQQHYHQQFDPFQKQPRQGHQQGQEQHAREQQAQAQEQQLLKGECQYDGHCPLRSTCEAAITGGGVARGGQVKAKGICQPMESRGIHDPTADEDPTATELCVSACRTELEMDEHFYQEA
jgi:hypothetical protein